MDLLFGVCFIWRNPACNSICLGASQWLIDYLSLLFLLMKTEDQWQSLNYTLVYVKEPGAGIHLLPYRRVMYRPIKAWQTLLPLLLTLTLVQPFLSGRRKRDPTRQMGSFWSPRAVKYYLIQASEERLSWESETFRSGSSWCPSDPWGNGFEFGYCPLLYGKWTWGRQQPEGHLSVRGGKKVEVKKNLCGIWKGREDKRGRGHDYRDGWRRTRPTFSSLLSLT